MSRHIPAAGHATKTGLWVFLFWIMLLSGGCMVLPLPNSRVEGYGIQSQVADEASGKPICDALVRDAFDADRNTRTDADGRFKLDANIQWHGGYLWGVISYPIWPFTGDIVVNDRSIIISAPGYEVRTVTVTDRARQNDEPDIVKAPTPTESYFDVPVLTLRKLGVPASQNAGQ